MKSARAVIHARNQEEPGKVLRACAIAGRKALIVVHGVIHRKDRIAFALIEDDLSIVGSECIQVRRVCFHILNRGLSEMELVALIPVFKLSIDAVKTFSEGLGGVENRYIAVVAP